MRALVSKSKIFAFNEERYKLCMKDELHKDDKNFMMFQFKYDN